MESIVELSRNKEESDAAISRATIANGIGLGMSVMRSLIGRELGNNPEINLTDQLAAELGIAIDNAIRAV